MHSDNNQYKKCFSCNTQIVWCKVVKTDRRKPILKWAAVTPAQILVSNAIKPLMAAPRHKRTWAVLLRTDTREFINRKQRGPVREGERLTEMKWEVLFLPPFLSSITPSTLPLVRQPLSPQNPPALFPDEAPIRPMKPDPGLLMELAKYHRLKNPCVINIPGSPASIHTCIQFIQMYHIGVHHRLCHLTYSNRIAYDVVGFTGKGGWSCRENHIHFLINEQQTITAVIMLLSEECTWF